MNALLRAASLTLCLSLASCNGPPGAITGYVGRYTNASLPEEIALAKPISFESSEMLALAYSQPFHQFADDGGQWEWEAQTAQHVGAQDNFELNALVVLRWKRFPWGEHLRTTAAIGEGLSWASEVPHLEERLAPEGKAEQLLNYMLIEFTFGLPTRPAWDLVFRIHHRSGVFGTFNGVEGGSNLLALGLKWQL